MEQLSTSLEINDHAWNYFEKLRNGKVKCKMCQKIIFKSLDTVHLHLYMEHIIYYKDHCLLWKNKKDDVIWQYFKKLDHYYIKCVKCNDVILYDSYTKIHMFEKHKEIFGEIEYYIKRRSFQINKYFKFKEYYAQCTKPNCQKIYDVFQENIKTILGIHISCHKSPEYLEDNINLLHIEGEIDYTYIRPYCTISNSVICWICVETICIKTDTDKIDHHIISKHAEKVPIIHKRFIDTLHCTWTSEHFEFKQLEVFCKTEGCDYSAKMHTVDLQEELKLHLALCHKRVQSAEFKEIPQQTTVKQIENKNLYDDFKMFGLYTLLTTKYIKCNNCDVVRRYKRLSMQEHISLCNDENYNKKRDQFLKTLGWIVEHLDITKFNAYCKYRNVCKYQNEYIIYERGMKTKLTRHLFQRHGIREKSQIDNEVTDECHEANIYYAGPSSRIQY